jgi:hypothetical protein
MRKVMNLVISFLFLGVSIFLVEQIYIRTIAMAMCRGVHCLDAYLKPNASYLYGIPDSCVFIGSPTGIGIFNDKPFGAFARNILGTEYIFFEHEFIFIENQIDKNKPIIVINRNPFIIENRSDKICGKQVEISINNEDSIQIKN